MAKKQIDGDGLDIPNRIKALPVKRTGPIVAAVIVALIAAMLLQGLITNPRFEWNVVWKYLFDENVREGIKYTLLLTVISMGIAIILAVILAVMRKSINPVLRGVSWFYIWFFRGTPVYTQLVFWGLFAVLVPRIGVGIPFTSIEFWSIDSQSVITAFNAAWLGLALNEAAYLAEIVRAGLEAVDPGQTEAAKALGMKRSMIMRRVVLPQAMRIIIPPTGNEFIGNLIAEAMEKVGSDGVTGMNSMYAYHFLQQLCAATGVDSIAAFQASKCLSADVTAAYDPSFSEAFEPDNGTYAGRGVAIYKYTGAGGKSSTSDANAELVSYLTRLMNKNGVVWQIGEMGRLDLGGGGTIAKYVANRDIDTIDIGVPVLAMHSPFEVVSKADVYMAYRTFRAFCADAE